MDASGVAWATGAELTPARPTWPREDDRAGEARASPPPSPAGGSVAPGEALGAPFSLFAAGIGLAKEYGRQASTIGAGSKTKIKHLLVVDHGLKLPPAELEAREPAAGVSLRRLGVK